MASVWKELKRRNVVKVAVAYVIVGWILVQVADTFFPALQLPEWTVTLVAVLVILVFPLALILSWAYDLTPQGVERTGSAPVSETITKVTGRKLDFAIIGLLAVALLGAGGFWFIGRDARWIRDEAIPQIEAYVAVGDSEAAYAMARQVEVVAPNDPALAELWSIFSWISRITSDPPGSTVFRRPYDAVDHEWEDLGFTPLEGIRSPLRGFSEVRLELEGYRPVLRAVGGRGLGGGTLGGARVTLDSLETLPDGKVRVSGWNEDVAGEPTPFGDFYLDRYEVTNREFKEFVEAGGYDRQNLWEYPVVQDGQTIPWGEAMALFTDGTGRPGPSTWQAGDYPDGQDDYPVTGVSWYEAAAYARYVGQELPSVYHWRRAFAPRTLPWMLPASNLEGVGPAPVGQFRGIGWTGTFDMAGNAREWCFNAIGDQRVILGGGWNDPYYLAQQTNSRQLPLDRSPTNGFRLAITHDGGRVAARARTEIVASAAPVITAIEPVSDEVFEAYRRMYDYDTDPLNAAIEATESTRRWTRERISFDAAYGGERMILYLYLPATGSPPYQTVLLWPGNGVRNLNSIDEFPIPVDFVLTSGRAVAFPVYKGTFERDGGGRLLPATDSAAFRELEIQRINDLRRSIDYLETRADIDPGAFSYFGVSWGGAHGPAALVLDPRLRVAVLHIPTVSSVMGEKSRPEVDQVTFLPRVEVPVLALSGEFDVIVPLETAAKPFMELLGAPDADKRHVIAPGGHFVPRELLIQETLDWLDKYLGPPSS